MNIAILFLFIAFAKAAPVFRADSFESSEEDDVFVDCPDYSLMCFIVIKLDGYTKIIRVDREFILKDDKEDFPTTTKPTTTNPTTTKPNTTTTIKSVTVKASAANQQSRRATSDGRAIYLWVSLGLGLGAGAVTILLYLCGITKLKIMGFTVKELLADLFLIKLIEDHPSSNPNPPTLNQNRPRNIYVNPPPPSYTESVNEPLVGTHTKPAPKSIGNDKKDITSVTLDLGQAKDNQNSTDVEKSGDAK